MILALYIWPVALGGVLLGMELERHLNRRALRRLARRGYIDLTRIDNGRLRESLRP